MKTVKRAARRSSGRRASVPATVTSGICAARDLDRDEERRERSYPVKGSLAPRGFHSAWAEYAQS